MQAIDSGQQRTAPVAPWAAVGANVWAAMAVAPGVQRDSCKARMETFLDWRSHAAAEVEVGLHGWDVTEAAGVAHTSLAH